MQKCLDLGFINQIQFGGMSPKGPARGANSEPPQTPICI